MNRIALIVTLSIIAVAGITILILWLTGVLFKSVDHSNDYISDGFMLDPRIENYEDEDVVVGVQLEDENEVAIMDFYKLYEKKKNFKDSESAINHMIKSALDPNFDLENELTYVNKDLHVILTNTSPPASGKTKYQVAKEKAMEEIGLIENEQSALERKLGQNQVFLNLKNTLTDLDASDEKAGKLRGDIESLKMIKVPFNTNIHLDMLSEPTLKIAIAELPDQTDIDAIKSKAQTLLDAEDTKINNLLNRKQTILSSLGMGAGRRDSKENLNETEEDVRTELKNIEKEIKQNADYINLSGRAMRIGDYSKQKILDIVLKTVAIEKLKERARGWWDKSNSRRKVICERKNLTKNTLELLTNSIAGNIILGKFVSILQNMILVDENGVEQPLYMFEETCTSEIDGMTNVCYTKEDEKITITVMDIIEQDKAMFDIKKNSAGEWSFTFEHISEEEDGESKSEYKSTTFINQTNIILTPKTIYWDDGEHKFYKTQDTQDTRYEMNYNEAKMSAKQFEQMMKLFNTEYLSKAIDKDFKACK